MHSEPKPEDATESAEARLRYQLDRVIARMQEATGSSWAMSEPVGFHESAWGELCDEFGWDSGAPQEKPVTP